MQELSQYILKYLKDFEKEILDHFKKKHRRGDRMKHIIIELVFPHLTINGIFMNVKLSKAQYQPSDPTNPQSPLVVTGKIAPTGAQSETEGVDNATIAWSSSNQNAATVAANATDPTKCVITWVGDGETTIGVTAKTVDDSATLSDSIDLTNVEPEATNLNLSLDVQGE